MKICSRCHQEKPLTDFHKRSDRPTGAQAHCKECQKNRKRVYLNTETGAKKAREDSKNYYYNNKELALENNKTWRNENKENRKEYSHVYETTRRERDHDTELGYKRKYLYKRYRSDVKFRLDRLVRTQVNRVIKKGIGVRTRSIVPFTYDELITHLRSTLPKGYLWGNYVSGLTDLQIDHIIPVAAFNFDSYQDIDFKRCWSLKNLRLIPKAENISKKDKIEYPFQPCLAISA